jgi:hypothetical protein
MANERINLKDASKGEWNHDRSIETINAGSFQRIADALEKVAMDRIQLERDLKYQRERAERALSNERHASRRIAALQGYITKLKKRIV